MKKVRGNENRDSMRSRGNEGMGSMGCDGRGIRGNKGKVNEVK